MKKQRIVILGAGISGLSLAWYLSQSSLPLEITILEKAGRAGGLLQTDHSTGFHFEKGPRAFTVDKSPFLVELLQGLGLEEKIVWSKERALHRYLWMKDRLVQFPRNPLSFLFSPLTRGFLKAAVTEWKKPVHYADETVWDFAKRRFNEDVARLFFDPMVVGIFGGDSRYISVRSCFPNLKRWEEEHGSVTKGFWHALKKRRKASEFSSCIPSLPLSAVYSLSDGVETIIHALLEKIRAEVHLGTEALAIQDLGSEVVIETNERVYKADAIFCALPVAQAGFLLKPLAPHLADQLAQVRSQSITVINFGYTQKVLPVEGFGYLTATHCNEEILGVVFDSFVFPEHNGRAFETRLTVKLDDRGLSRDSMIEVALQGLKKHLGVTRVPDAMSYKLAVHAIPQYGVGHLDKTAQFDRQMKEMFPRLCFVGNYLSGVSVDRCIERSKSVAQQWIQQHL